MTERKHMKDIIDFKAFQEVLRVMDRDEFEDWICELEDLFTDMHPELEEE